MCYIFFAPQSEPIYPVPLNSYLHYVLFEPFLLFYYAIICLYVLRNSTGLIICTVIVGSLSGTSKGIKAVERFKASQVAWVWSCDRHHTWTRRSHCFLPCMPPAWHQYP